MFLKRRSNFSLRFFLPGQRAIPSQYGKIREIFIYFHGSIRLNTLFLLNPSYHYPFLPKSRKLRIMVTIILEREMRLLFLNALILANVCCGQKNKKFGTGDGEKSLATGRQIQAEAPSFDFTNRAGCGDLFVYAKNDSFTEILAVGLSRDQLGISTKESIFEIAKESSQNLQIYFEQSRSDIEEIKRFEVCDDQRFSDVPKAKRWPASQGTVTVKISTDSPKPGVESYNATLHLENVKIQDPTSEEEMTIDSIDFNEVSVGWFPG
jgi:hypothetical protein